MFEKSFSCVHHNSTTSYDNYSGQSITILMLHRLPVPVQPRYIS